MGLKIESIDPLDRARAEDREREAEKIYGTLEDVTPSDLGDDSEDGKTADVDSDLALLDLETEEYLDIQADPGEDIITRLAPGVRDQNRVNVYINGRFAFSLDVVQVVDFKLKVGLKISPARLTELKEASEFGKLYQRTLEWCMTRPHSILEAKLYLRRRIYKRKLLNRKRAEEEKRPLEEISEKNAELVLERLIEKKYLNDKVFAKYFVENRYIRKGISQKRLYAELLQKGVDKAIINEALQNSPRVEEEEIAKVVMKKRKKYNDKGLLQYLVRQGFSYQAAKNAVEESSTENLYKYDY